MTDLFLARIEADLPAVIEGARLDHIPTWRLDDGYLLHTALARSLGDAAPHPFALQGTRGRRVEILGYTRHDADELRRRGRQFAHPDVWQAVDFEGMRTKPMPAAWPEGQRVGFSLRACPVVRLSSAANGHRAGAEVDAFLAEAWKAGADTFVDREAVYLRWLEGRLAATGSARVVEARVVGHRRQNLVRRTQGQDRKARRLERPEVHFEGTLQIANGDAFGALLARGVGRHRAFGFGMLLLRPARA